MISGRVVVLEVERQVNPRRVVLRLHRGVVYRQLRVQFRARGQATRPWEKRVRRGAHRVQKDVTVCGDQVEADRGHLYPVDHVREE